MTDGIERGKKFLGSMKNRLNEGDGIIKHCDIKKLTEDESLTATEALKKPVLSDFKSPKLEPLLDIRLNPLKEERSNSDYAYSIHLGYIKNYINSTTNSSKTLFLKNKFDFPTLLMDFYRSLFQGVHIEKIKEAINDEDSLHVVLFYRQRVLSNQNDVTFLDTIMAAASFNIKKEFT